MSIEFKTLEQFMPFWAQKILPAVYDDSLSYYQLLCRILQKYNEIIEVVNKHSETLVDHENRITTNTQNIELNRQQIEALKGALADLEKKVQQNTANIATLTDRVNAHDNDIQALQTTIDNLVKFNTNVKATIDPTTHALKILVADYVPDGGTAVFRAVKFADWHKNFRYGKNIFPIDKQPNTGEGVCGFVVIVDKITNAPPGYADFETFGALIENGKLHYFTAVYNKTDPTDEYAGIAEDTIGAGSAWKEVELLDITNIKQSAGDSEYDTISQKIITEMFNSKLPAGMGISGASAGDFVKITAVDADGKPTEYGSGTPAGGSTTVVQTTGQSTTDVMSQKAVTDNFNEINEYFNDLRGKISDVSSSANVTIKYPSTVGGTDGKFLGFNGLQIINYTRADLLYKFFGTTGANKIFTVQKTGETSFNRIAWYKSTAGEGLYDFAWYETDGTTARTGVDRLTMNTVGNFAVSEQSSTVLSGGGTADYLVISGEICDFAASYFTSRTSREFDLSTTLGSTPVEVITALHKIPRPAIQLQQSDNTTVGVQTVVLTPSYNAIPSSVSNGGRYDLYTGAIRGVNSQGTRDYMQIYCTIVIEKGVAKLEINFIRTA